MRWGCFWDAVEVVWRAQAGCVGNAPRFQEPCRGAVKPGFLGLQKFNRKHASGSSRDGLEAHSSLVLKNLRVL